MQDPVKAHPSPLSVPWSSSCKVRCPALIDDIISAISQEQMAARHAIGHKNRCPANWAIEKLYRVQGSFPPPAGSRSLRPEPLAVGHRSLSLGIRRSDGLVKVLAHPSNGLPGTSGPPRDRQTRDQIRVGARHGGRNFPWSQRPGLAAAACPEQDSSVRALLNMGRFLGKESRFLWGSRADDGVL